MRWCVETTSVRASCLADWPIPVGICDKSPEDVREQFGSLQWSMSVLVAIRGHEASRIPEELDITVSDCTNGSQLEETLVNLRINCNRDVIIGRHEQLIGVLLVLGDVCRFVEVEVGCMMSSTVGHIVS